MGSLTRATAACAKGPARQLAPSCVSNRPDAPRDGALRPSDVGISVGAVKDTKNARHPCSNLSMQRELCPSNKFVWKYYMATHVAQAHGGENGVGGGGTPAFRRSFSIPKRDSARVLGRTST